MLFVCIPCVRTKNTNIYIYIYIYIYIREGRVEYAMWRRDRVIWRGKGGADRKRAEKSEQEVEEQEG